MVLIKLYLFIKLHIPVIFNIYINSFFIVLINLSGVF